jgi:hypothetical protein
MARRTEHQPESEPAPQSELTDAAPVRERVRHTECEVPRITRANSRTDSGRSDKVNKGLRDIVRLLARAAAREYFEHGTDSLNTPARNVRGRE